MLLNLGNTEVFFPEKRPFFNEGLDLFTPVPVHLGDGPHRLFYSRRVGLDTPVLGAAKLVGAVADGLEMGVLEALVTGAANPATAVSREAGSDPELDTRVQLHPLRPLHLGVNGELPPEEPFARNFLAAALRQRVLGSSFVGLGFTDVTPLSRRCEREDFGVGPAFDEEAWATAGCEAPGSTAAAADFNLRTDDGVWGIRGQLTGSRRKGDVPALRLLDGTMLESGDLGYGAYLNGGKFGGGPLQLFVYYEHSSPTFDLNGAGFNADQNLQALFTEARWLRSKAFGPFLRSRVGLYAGRKWSTDGTGLYRGTETGLFASGQLPAAVGLKAELDYKDEGFDPREIRGRGIPYEKGGSVWLSLGVETDASRPLSGRLYLSGYRNLPRGELEPSKGFIANTEVSWRPLPYLETTLGNAYEDMAFPARYLAGGAEAPLLFAALRTPRLSFTLRQQVVLAPTLTLQGYAQLFSATGTFGPYYATGPHQPGDPVRMTDLSRLSPEELATVAPDGRRDDFEVTRLNVNIVMRWEYRLGSTLFAVYSRSQANDPRSALTRTLLPDRLGSGPITDAFMLKWSYLWDAKL